MSWSLMADRIDGTVMDTIGWGLPSSSDRSYGIVQCHVPSPCVCGMYGYYAGQDFPEQKVGLQRKGKNRRSHSGISGKASEEGVKRGTAL